MESRGVDENLFALGAIGHGHDPILAASILTHDAIDDANVGISLRVNHAAILAGSHSGKNLVKVVHHDFVASLKKHFLSLFLVSIF